MYWIHRALAFAAIVVFHFWSPTDTLNRLAPLNEITATLSVPYGDGPRHQLDIYAPRSITTPAPVVVFFYGGGWQEGMKAWYRFVGAGLAARGIVAVIPDYRLYPEVRFPDFIDDAAQAVAWVHANAFRFGADPRRLFVMGHSAGGQIATLLALDPHYLRSAGLSQRDICGVIGLAGPYDYVPPVPVDFARIFGSADKWPVASPINYVTSASPPMLLLTGTADSGIEPGNALRLADRLRSAGVPVTVGLYPGINHAALIASLSDTMGFLAPTRADVLGFISKQASCAR